MWVRKMIFACDHCHFLFSRTRQPEQCPDCGKYTVRPATEDEQAEFERRLENDGYRLRNNKRRERDEI